jgi:hypothetical protein
MIFITLLSNIIPKVYAVLDGPPGGGSSGGNIFGQITNPLSGTYGDYAGSNGSGGIIGLLSNILRLVFVVAGIYALFNFIIAGYQYMTAGGDAKALSSAWNRIWQTLLGLVIIVASFALAALFGQLIFGDAGYILNPSIYGPN